MKLLRLALVLALPLVAGAFSRSSTPPALQLVETFPIETDLDHADIPEAHEVWLEMIQGAMSTLDLAQFYLSNEAGSRLEPVIQAVEAAADRGVAVRVLAENNFYKTYPETLDRLGARENIEVRRFRVRDVMGGVLHAKYFIVDGTSAFVGSQNFDWRALAHIQELGLRIREKRVATPLLAVFDLDWELAAAGQESDSSGNHNDALQAPTQEYPGGAFKQLGVKLKHGGERARVTVVASPQDWLPENVAWDLPALLDLLDGAEHSVRVQLLSYRTRGRDDTEWTRLDDALRRAAARGARVEMLLADWSKRASSLAALQSLQRLEGITVKFVTIPTASRGFIPFGRVIHAKYLVVDGRAAWLGTSNWEKSYFFTSRNVGLVVEGAAFAKELDAFFETGWSSELSYVLDPEAEYTPPRIGP